MMQLAHQRLIFFQTFGGLGMMYVGHLLQLQSVRGRFIFAKHQATAAHFEEQSLWHGLESVTLKRNHRKGEGSAWTNTF